MFKCSLPQLLLLFNMWHQGCCQVISVTTDPDVGNLTMFDGEKTYVIFNFVHYNTTNYTFTIFINDHEDVSIASPTAGFTLYHFEALKNNRDNIISEFHVLLIEGSSELDQSLVQCRYTETENRAALTYCNVSILLTIKEDFPEPELAPCPVTTETFVSSTASSAPTIWFGSTKTPSSTTGAVPMRSETAPTATEESSTTTEAPVETREVNDAVGEVNSTIGKLKTTIDVIDSSVTTYFYSIIGVQIVCTFAILIFIPICQRCSSSDSSKGPHKSSETELETAQQDQLPAGSLMVNPDVPTTLHD